MAEPGGDSGEFRGTIAGQAVAFSTNNLTQILIIVLLGVLGVLIWKQLDKRLDTAGKVIVERLDALHAHHAKLHEMLSGNRENTHEEIERVMKALAVINWNLTHDETQQLPLGVNGVPVKPPGQ